MTGSKVEQIRSCCGSCCSCFCTMKVFGSIFVLIWARVYYDIAFLSPMLSEQWFAEMIWWTKFIVLAPLNPYLEPVSLDLLKVEHSPLNVMEFWAHNDSKAMEKFLFYADNPDYDDSIVILRNLFHDPENKIGWLNSTEALKEHLDTEKEVDAVIFPVNEPFRTEKTKLSQILDVIEDTSEQLTYLTFTYGFWENQKFIWDAYNAMWEKYGFKFPDAIKNCKKYITHTFMYYGTEGRAALHAGPVVAYFLQVSNTKHWKFVNKKYTPYLGTVQDEKGPVLLTPLYVHNDYPKHLPVTETYTRPGDLIYFSKYHFHEVWNLEKETLGLAIAVRPFRLPWQGHFKPLNLYQTWGMFKKRPNNKVFKDANTFSSDNKATEDSCKSNNGWPWINGYNGTSVTRFDFMRINGSCQYGERISDFQSKEVNGEIGVFDWKPKI